MCVIFVRNLGQGERNNQLFTILLDLPNIRLVLIKFDRKCHIIFNTNGSIGHDVILHKKNYSLFKFCFQRYLRLLFLLQFSWPYVLSLPRLPRHYVSIILLQIFHSKKANRNCSKFSILNYCYTSYFVQSVVE